MLAFLALVAAASASQVQFLSVPSGLNLKETARPAPIGSLPTFISEALGVSSELPFAWDVIASADVFYRPQAAVTILLDGIEGIKVAERSYALIDECTSTSECLEQAVSGADKNSAAALVASFFGNPASSLAVSYSNDVAESASVENGNKISFNSVTKSFSHSNGQAVVAAADVSALIAGLELDQSKPEIVNLIEEMSAMLGAITLQSLSTSSSSPSVITLVVSTLRAAVSVATTTEQLQALRTLCIRFVNAVNSKVQSVFGSRSLVSVVTLPFVPRSTLTKKPKQSDLPLRIRRSSSPTGLVGAVPGNIPSCMTYLCYCRSNASGVQWGSNGCSNPNTKIDCVYDGCNCDTALPSSIMQGLEVCTQCAEGYLLYNGYCYIDSDYPGLVNIVLWLGLAIVLGLIATCYATAGMDPGRNSAIFRTAAHAKQH